MFVIYVFHHQASSRAYGEDVVRASGGHQTAAERGELPLGGAAARHGGAAAAVGASAAAARTAAARAEGHPRLDQAHQRHARYSHAGMYHATSCCQRLARIITVFSYPLIMRQL